jgi:iron complex transport system ATP-binding protein
MSLELSNVGLKLGGFFLNEISTEVAPGSILGIGGQNGSGKSTLLKLMYGFLKPHEGFVRLDGKPISKLPPREISRKIAVVNQEISEPFNFTALEVVNLSGYSRADEDSTPLAAMEACGVAHLASRGFSELSGGASSTGTARRWCLCCTT